ncbi:MAG: iron ABC transporter permease [Patulibacter sp.]
MGVLAVSLIGSLGIGSTPIPAADAAHVVATHLFGAAMRDPAVDAIVWDLRAPRGLLAVAVGAGLAVTGATMQTLVRNPLADPHLLGVSAGASVGATAVITGGAFAGAGSWALSAGAFAGALAAAALVFLVAAAQGGLAPLRLVLTGTVMASAFSALASYLVFSSDEPQAAQSVLFWLLGSFAGAEWSQLPVPVAVVAVGTLVLLGLGGWLDALAAGPETAASLGVSVRWLRIALFVVLAVVVGAMVAVAGAIGFVGLIVPHMARLLVGARHRVVLPTAALIGATFTLWVDVAARLVGGAAEIPLSVITGLLGAPAFLLLLGRRRSLYGGPA